MPPCRTSRGLEWYMFSMLGVLIDLSMRNCNNSMLSIANRDYKAETGVMGTEKHFDFDVSGYEHIEAY